MSLTSEPRTSRLLGVGKLTIIDRYGSSFWLEMLKAAERADRISELPKRFQDAYRFMRRKLRENEVASV